MGGEVRNAENTVQAEVRACAKVLGQKGEFERLKEKTGRLAPEDLQKINKGLNISFGLDGTY